MAGQTRLPGEPGSGGWEGQGTAPARVAHSLTPNPPQVGFFPSECVELFTERPGPGLKGGKCQGQNGEASLPSLPIIQSFHPLFTPQKLMVPSAVSQRPRVSPL